MFTLSPHRDHELILGFVHNALFATIIGSSEFLFTKSYGWPGEKRRV